VVCKAGLATGFKIRGSCPSEELNKIKKKKKKKKKIKQKYSSSPRKAGLFLGGGKSRPPEMGESELNQGSQSVEKVGKNEEKSQHHLRTLSQGRNPMGYTRLKKIS